jgi:hypothetical protein
LAVCSAVADISDRLTISNQTKARNLGVSLGVANDEPARKARLSNGLFLVGGTTTCNLNISWPHPSANASGEAAAIDGQESFLPARTSLAFSDEDGRVSSAIANFFLVYTNQTSEVASGSQQGVFRAAEVLLHFCVNTYTVSTSRGLSITKLVHSSTLAAQDTPIGLRDAPTPSRRVMLRAASDVDVYSVKRDDVKLLNNYLLSLFSGTYSSRYGRTIGGETATSEALGLSMFRGELDAEAMRTVINNLTINVATSLTNTQVVFPSASRRPFLSSLSLVSYHPSLQRCATISVETELLDMSFSYTFLTSGGNRHDLSSEVGESNSSVARNDSERRYTVR